MATIEKSPDNARLAHHPDFVGDFGTVAGVGLLLFSRYLYPFEITSVLLLAALVGLAPYADDSGTLKGPRRIRGGRADVRRVLYLAALSASRRGSLKDFAERLRSRGKTAKVVLIAVARTLLVIANAVIRTGRAWQPELAMAR